VLHYLGSLKRLHQLRTQLVPLIAVAQPAVATVPPRVHVVVLRDAGGVACPERELTHSPPLQGLDNLRDGDGVPLAVAELAVLATPPGENVGNDLLLGGELEVPGRTEEVGGSHEFLRWRLANLRELLLQHLLADSGRLHDLSRAVKI
jgi:hypothetical protein